MRYIEASGAPIILVVEALDCIASGVMDAFSRLAIMSCSLSCFSLSRLQ